MLEVPAGSAERDWLIKREVSVVTVSISRGDKITLIRYHIAHLAFPSSMKAEQKELPIMRDLRPIKSGEDG